MKKTASHYIGGLAIAALAALTPNASWAATTIPAVNYYGYFGNTQGETRIQTVKNGEAIYYAGSNEHIVASTSPPVKNLDGRSFQVLINGVYQIQYAVHSYRLDGATTADVPSAVTDNLAISLKVNGKVDVAEKNDCSTYGLIPPLAAIDATQTLRGDVSHSCLMRLYTGNKITLVPTWTIPASSKTWKSTLQMVFSSSDASNNANVFTIMFTKISD